LNPFNPAQPIPGIPAVYGPDTTTNYELGWKISFPSHGAIFNGAVYHIDWKDIQVPDVVPVPGGPPTAQQQFFRNAGRAKVDGLELEGGLELLRGLRITASLALMNPVITQDEPLTPDTPGFFASAYCLRGCPARSGDSIPWVPKASGSFTLGYRRTLAAGRLEGFAVLTEQYTGKRNTDFAASWRGPSQPDAPCAFAVAGTSASGGPSGMCPRTHAGDPNPAFRVIRAALQTNLQAGIEDRHWRAAIFVDNVFDRRDPIGVAPAFGMGSDNGDAWLGNRPRTIGLWVRRNID
jgi:outer membrane receptor protein involved in Fe transport